MQVPSYIEIVAEEDDPEEVRELAEAQKSTTGLYKLMIKHAKNHELGLYRCDRYDLALLHKSKKEYFEALLLFLEVFYLDINGPQNVGHMFDPELDKGRKTKEWDPRHTFIAPAVIYYCQLMMKRTKTPIESVKKTFAQAMLTHFENFKLPISPEEAWPRIENNILNWKQHEEVLK